jgi:putative CocE/NonD family hydrolase
MIYSDNLSTNAEHVMMKFNTPAWIRISFASSFLVLILASCGKGPDAGSEANQAAAVEPTAAPSEAVAEPGKVSKFGEYEGFSEEKFTEWVNTSRYVQMRDGVKLAVDVTFPAVDGKAVEDRFPVVWTHSRYHRNPGALAKFFAEEGEEIPEINSQVDANPALQQLVRHGYIVAAVQVRGGGASYGTYEGLFSDSETDDAYEIVEWLATQPWSTGAVGMYGGSYLGMTQYMVASRRHPALKAIFPIVAGLDMYDVLYPGGVYREDMIDHWGGLTRNLDVNWPSSEVDEDVEGVMLKEAIAEHENNWDVEVEYAAGRYRDHDIPTLTWADHGVSGVLTELQQANVPAYHWNGWFDIFILDTVLIYNNYAGPQKMGISAWSHGGMPDEKLMQERGRLTMIEQHRWFDYWLKGIDNGIMDEPPINYAVMNDPGDWSWESAQMWPLPEAGSQTLYLGSGASGTVASVNDGLLTGSPASGSGVADSYTVDLTTTTGTSTRWDNAVGGARLMIYPDMTENDSKSLTYTTEPLEADLNVTGHPVVTLYVSSSNRDGVFIVLLEEIDEEGISHYVTEGVLKASHRVLGEAPWNNIGLPFQRSNKEDVQPLPEDKPGELVMDLHPTSNVFNKGHRLRLTIMGADADNIELPDKTPTVQVYRDSVHASRIELPVAGGL